ncbi:MAG TPA: GtrA family protein [Xanthobacteraceae bacterium]|nr:GtrA family protein [Xanthobacteraceae bacterium]
MIGRTLMRQSTRYLAGGLACALLHNVIMIATSAWGMPYPPALVLSFSVTTPIGYAIHSAYTFETRYSTRRLQRFMAGAVSGFVVSAALMVLFCSGLAMPVAVATPIATVLVFFWNFALARWAILDLLTPWERLR